MELEPIKIEPDGRVSTVLVQTARGQWYTIDIDPPVEWAAWYQLELEFDMPGPVMRSDSEALGVEDRQALRDELPPTLPESDESEGIDVVHCAQCDVDCAACAIGEIHMNIEPPFEGYTHDQTAKVNWPEHNRKGHHHIMWNGDSNETVPCGSVRAAELTIYILQERAREAEADQRTQSNRRQVGGSHYGLGAMQHWDVVVMFDLDYFQGQITKYVMRWDKKNGVQDLEKAGHFLEKYIEEIKAGRITKGQKS